MNRLLDGEMWKPHIKENIERSFIWEAGSVILVKS